MSQPVRLYTQSRNPYSEKVAYGLHLKGVAHERVVSDDPDDIKRWSPVTKQLPVLEANGERIHESSEILRFVDETWPEPPLVSPDPLLAEKQWRFAEWSDTSFVWYYNRWRAALFPQPGDERPAAPSVLGSLRGGVLRSLGLADDRITQRQARLLEISSEVENRLDDLVGLLGDRPFFHSDQASVADLSVYGMLIVMRDRPLTLGDGQVHTRPQLVAYMERMDKLTRPPPGTAEDLDVEESVPSPS